MAGNTMTLEFAGDATKLQRAAKQSSAAIEDVGKSAKSAGDDFTSSAKESTNFVDKIGKLGAGVSGMTDAVDSASGVLDAFNDIQNAGYEKAQRLARANTDVMQAQEDLNQAIRDGKQAAIDADQAEVDLEQARLDQATALKDYNAAVKEHGKNSAEARQAQIDLKQAGVDVKQAQEDAAQATRDASQANIDAKTAQLDLNDAQREANPPDVAAWSQQLQTYAPLLNGLVGIVGLVTAAQWAWNAAQTANPIGLIIVAVGALIAIIVVIATKTTWFQDLWRVTWGGIKKAASAVGSWFKDTLWGKWIKGSWDAIMNKGVQVYLWFQKLPGKLKAAFANIAISLYAPFRAAFNKVSDAWNNTIGRLSWTVPGWIPGIGGASISAPQLPKFHQGGVVPGPPGTEVPILAMAGETVTPAGGGAVIEIRSSGSQLDDLLVEILSRSIRRRGGNVQTVLGGRNA
jgi:hypothetical protein